MDREKLAHRAKVVGAHAALITAANFTTTLFLHRAETHGAIELSRPVRELGRFVTWLTSGMKPREWVVVHRKHHAHTDQEGDPHSPAEHGVLPIFFGNGLYYYRKAAKEITPEEIPEHLRPDRKDKILYDHGLLGQVAMFAGFTWLHKGNKKHAATSLAIQNVVLHDALALSGGGFVNAWLHRGKGNLKTLFRKPEPMDYKDGSPPRYTRDSGAVVAFGMAGEGKHDKHHKDQTAYRFDERWWHDPGGAIGAWMIRRGWAQPGTGPKR